VCVCVRERERVRLWERERENATHTVLWQYGTGMLRLRFYTVLFKLMGLFGRETASYNMRDNVYIL